jgi:hypothetical protein
MRGGCGPLSKATQKSLGYPAGRDEPLFSERVLLVEDEVSQRIKNGLPVDTLWFLNHVWVMAYDQIGTIRDQPFCLAPLLFFGPVV